MTNFVLLKNVVQREPGSAGSSSLQRSGVVDLGVP